jgi:inositol transport system substrate-binding protein
VKRTLLTAAAAIAIASPALADTNIGVTMALFDDNFLTKVREAIKDEADKTQGTQVQFEDAQADIGRQINQVQNFIAQKVDAIIVNPADTAATKKITEMVTAAGIPLVYVNRGPDQKQLPPKVSVVVSDHVAAGRMEMEELAKCMKDKGNVAIMLGELASNATQERTQGNKDVIAKFPEMKVVQEQTANYQRNQAIDLMNNWLASGNQIDAVVANNDEMAIGAIIAMQQAGVDPKTKCVGGVDGTADALAEMQKGNLYATVFQDARGQGRGAVDAAVKLAKGEKVDTFVMIPYEPINRDNYKQYLTR